MVSERFRALAFLPAGRLRTPAHTSTKANSVPMLVRSVTIAMSTNNEGMPTTNPVMMVANEGV